MNVTSGGKKLRADSSDYSLHVAGPQLWASALLNRMLRSIQRGALWRIQEATSIDRVFSNSINSTSISRAMIGGD